MILPLHCSAPIRRGPPGSQPGSRRARHLMTESSANTIHAYGAALRGGPHDGALPPWPWPGDSPAK
eukprot:1790514-Pyramimonas_sp.AAC.1